MTSSKNGECAGIFSYIFFSRNFPFVLIAIFNPSEQSSAFNHEYGSWASEPKASTPTVRVIKCTFAHAR
jgi:hypothetical protein